jgi:hypothetical protein
MIVCKGVSKQGMRVHRSRHAIALEAALLELMRLYDRIGGPSEPVAGQIEAEIERSLVERGIGRERMHSHLQLLLRARDLHDYVREDGDLVALKLRLYEHLLYHRGTAERWAAARELLLEHLDLICETPLPGLASNAELYKRHLSERDSRLGKLLLTVALFNLDLVGEEPPANLILHIRRGRFPHHWWEIGTPDGRTSHPGTVESWSPAEPLCRWEYLAADLLHALLRRLQDPTRRPLWHRGTAAGVTGERANGAPAPGETLYCRFVTDGPDDGPAQLELLPLELGALLTALLQRVHRKQGPEGVKLLAVLCARLGQGAPEAGVELSLADVAGEAGLGGLSARHLQARAQRLERVVGELQQVELTRVSPAASDGARARTSRLVTVLGRSGDWSDNGTRQSGSAANTALHLRVDPWLSQSTGGGLAEVFQALPGTLLECAGKEHPCLLPLYVWLRRVWRESDGAALERPARALLDEAGVWVSETGRYRAIEALKRDLEFMREHGWLGAWRLQRSELRDAMEDRYRLSAPTASSNVPALASRPASRDGWEALPGA